MSSLIVYSAESPLRHPVLFLSAARQDLLRSRETALRLFRQTIAQRYRHSSLGLLWAFVPPLVVALLLTMSRHGASPTRSSATPPQFYAVFGLMLAQTFLETFNTQRTIFTNHQHLLSRRNATVEGIVLAGMADNLFGLAIKVAILIGFAVVLSVTPAVTAPLGVIGIGAVFLLGSGLGLLAAPLSALKPDVGNVTTVFPWLLFGLTPIFVQPVPGAWLFSVYRLNPFTWIFDAVRAFTYGHPQGYGLILFLSIIVSVGLFAFAALCCRVARPYVVERFLK